MQSNLSAPCVVLLAAFALLTAVEGRRNHGSPFVTSKLVVQEVPPTPEEQSAADASNAKEAADSAKAAAGVANAVAVHSVDVSNHATHALEKARNALHLARANTDGLSKDQEEALHKAEGKLASASVYKRLEVDAHALEHKRLEYKLSVTNSGGSELAEMRTTLRELRAGLAAKRRAGNADNTDAAVEQELESLEAMLKQLEAEEKAGVKSVSHDELKNQIERLREIIAKEDLDESKVQQLEVHTTGEQKLQYKLEAHPAVEEVHVVHPAVEPCDEVTATSSGSGSIDIDTMMPYGELEPFGREDTAQELTESSVRESDMMVDQLERAEVAEEKRAVFRALTRLRGAAITSFDGVARSQTGNIDEYNKVHQWRSTHPLHHLADEESDISKWAFPDNADF